MTRDLKDGSVMFVRSLFRSFITLVSEDLSLSSILSLENKRMLDRAANLMKELDVRKVSPDEIIA